MWSAAGPVVGLRTSSHAFKIPKGKTYSKFDFQYGGKEYEKGLRASNPWEHLGWALWQNHRQATQIQIVKGQKDNLILRGVG
jgi:hypothetical protein